jgi:hypothetical protein
LFCKKVNASLLLTVKHGPTLPFVFGATNYRRSREQKIIPENGCQTVLSATRDIDGKKFYLTAYCNRPLLFCRQAGSWSWYNVPKIGCRTVLQYPTSQKWRVWDGTITSDIKYTAYTD